LKNSIGQNEEKPEAVKPSEPSSVAKITAAWGLSESALGGLLHALRLPFRGMIISGIAIILISLIAKFTEKRGRITRSMLIVVMIKALISPHTPLQAYLSVFLQGVLGELLFITKKFRFLSSMLLGIIVSLLNGFQKIIVLTLIYGQNLWKTIDDFYLFVNQEWFNSALDENLVFSHWMIGGYILVHFLVGVAAGMLAYIVPKKVELRLSENLELPEQKALVEPDVLKKPKSKRWIKPSGLAVIILSVGVILLSYLYPESSGFDITAVLFMLVRSFLVLALWFYFVAPIIKKYLVKFFKTKSESRYAAEVDSIINFFPRLKVIIAASWSFSSAYFGLNRLFQFLIYSIAFMLKEEKQQG